MIHILPTAIEKNQTDPFFKKWDKLKTDIYSLHAMREETVDEPMREGFELFLDLLKQSHAIDSIDWNRVSELEGLPLNGVERLQFIEKQIGQYVSFRQLDELFSEMNKKLARLRVQK